LSKGIWVPHYAGGASWPAARYWGGDGSDFKRKTAWNGEQQIYVDPRYGGRETTPLGLDPFKIRNGVLSIVASRTPPELKSVLFNNEYISGILTTQGSFSQKYGYFEIRSKIPVGVGVWPAFWMLGAPLRAGVTWPQSGEVDIMEDINGRSSDFSTIHCGVSPGGPCNESTGIGSGERACSGCQTGFHDYAAEIDRSVSPEQIRFYLDGNNFFTVNANQVDATTWSNAIDHPFFIIYDLAIGGGFPDAFGGGPNAATVSGGKLVIDSVAVYNMAPGCGGGGGGSVTGQTITGPGGKCVDVAGDDTGGDGTAVQLWDCQSAAKDQHWTWSGQTLQTLGKCLDIAGGNSAAGTQLQLATCNSGGYQAWVRQTDGSLRNPTSGRCIDSPSGATANGTRLEIWDCNGSGAQKFALA